MDLHTREECGRSVREAAAVVAPLEVEEVVEVTHASSVGSLAIGLGTVLRDKDPRTWAVLLEKKFNLVRIWRLIVKCWTGRHSRG